MAAAIYMQAAYSRIETLRQMRDIGRALFTNSLRKMAGASISPVGPRRVVGLLGIPHTEIKNPKDHRIEEVQIPTMMKTRAPSLAQLTGLCAGILAISGLAVGTNFWSGSA